MKPYAFTLLLSIFLVCLFGAAGHVYGYHSTPGIWLALLNLPGIVAVAWVNGVPGFCIAIAVNWIAYSCFLGIALFFKRSLKSTR